MKARENIVQLWKQFTTDKRNVQLQNTYHNSYFICTSANLYVGIIYSFSTSAKQKAQLQNTWHNCKSNCTTAKKNELWQFSFALHSSCAIVSVFWLRREIVFGCTDQLVVAGNSFRCYLLNYHEGKGKYSITAKTIHNWQTECTTAKYIAQQQFHLHISNFVRRNNI